MSYSSTWHIELVVVVAIVVVVIVMYYITMHQMGDTRETRNHDTEVCQQCYQWYHHGNTSGSHKQAWNAHQFVVIVK